jgi:DNA-directed RNA polymerase specialized sigma subunit
LCKWLGVSTEIFTIGKKSEQTELSEKEKLVYQLRSSKELDPDSINAMITMVEIAFTKLKKNAK